jgi:DNA-binding LacI/PurR family transcriptional regulator
MARKRVTSSEVAREAGVSRTTVSFVLNNAPNTGIPEETRRKVLDAAARLRYYPNVSGRRLASGRTETVAFVMHQSPDRAAADLFLPQVLLGLVDITRQNDYHILLHPVDPDNLADDYSDLIYEGHVDGIILSGPQQCEPEAVALHDQGYPIVVTGRLREGIACVDADNYQGAQLATNHLLALGHRRIGLITNAPRIYLGSEERCRGYSDALLAAGIEPDATIMREGFFTSSSGFQAMSDLLDVPDRPTAVFVASDVVAFGAIQAAKSRGLTIPQDVAIVGFDDISISHCIEPPLTSVRLPAYQLGWHAGQMLLQLIGKEPPANLLQLLPTELVVRQSCGAPPGSGLVAGSETAVIRGVASASGKAVTRWKSHRKGGD